MDMNNNITYTDLFTDQLKEDFNNIKGPVKRIYAVMTFNTEFELGLSNKPYVWINSGSTVTLNGEEALSLYINSDVPMTKIIDAESFEELNEKMIQMVNNFKNPKYVNNEIESRFYE